MLCCKREFFRSEFHTNLYQKYSRLLKPQEDISVFIDKNRRKNKICNPRIQLQYRSNVRTLWGHFESIAYDVIVNGIITNGTRKWIFATNGCTSNICIWYVPIHISVYHHYILLTLVQFYKMHLITVVESNRIRVLFTFIYLTISYLNKSVGNVRTNLILPTVLHYFPINYFLS